MPMLVNVFFIFTVSFPFHRQERLLPRSDAQCLGIPSNIRHKPKVRSMLAHHLRRWPNIDPTMGYRLVFYTGIILLLHTIILSRCWCTVGAASRTVDQH